MREERKRRSKASVERERERGRKDGGCRVYGSTAREGGFMRGLFSLV